jgi:predicted O-methyltransferase YrrM
LTPKFYEVAKDSFDDFPRPSTEIIHRIYREKPLVGVEIGTGFGENATSLLYELSIERLYCIDPFVPYSCSEDGVDKIQTDYSSRSEHTLKRLSKFKNVTFIRKFSSEACEEIPENVDFVYIDGNHDYDYVLADLRNYYPLIHEKGIIAGHDVNMASVRKALADFCRENIIRPFILPPDWIITR